MIKIKEGVKYRIKEGYEVFNPEYARKDIKVGFDSSMDYLRFPDIGGKIEFLKIHRKTLRYKNFKDVMNDFYNLITKKLLGKKYI